MYVCVCVEAGLVKRSRLMGRANCKDDKEANLCWCPTVGTTVWEWKGEGGRNRQKQ